MNMSEIKVQSAYLILLGLLFYTPTAISQGCSITDNPGQLISIYNVPTSGGPDVIETYHIENAIVIDNAYNEDMKEEYIGATLNDETLIIHKTDKFVLYAENESETSINFKVQFRCRDGNTEGTSNPYTFTIYLLAGNDNAPTFQQSEYTLEVPLPLPSNFELTFYGQIFARDIDLGDNQVQFSGGNSYFTIGTIGRSASNPKEYYMSIRTARQILLLPAEAATIQVTARDNGGLTGQTTVQINVDPDNSYSRDPSPTFMKATYNFRIDEGGNYYNEFCYVTEESFVEQEITFTLSGQDQSHFIISEVDGRSVNILFSGIYDEAEFGERTYLIVELLASREGYETGHATIFVDLPVVCSSDTTTPRPCEITTCPDSDGPIFSQKLYTYRVFEGTVGLVGQVEASVEDVTLLPTLRYRLNYNDAAAWVEEVLTIDEISGSITISEKSLPENTNTFNVEVLATVEDQEVTKVGSARILVAFDKNEQCSATPVSKTLTFVTVKEEQRNTNIFPMTVGECEYELLSYTPNDKEYLYVDEEQQLSTIAIDRESESFGQMTVAQVQARLKLVCPSEDLLGRRQRRAVDDFVDNVFTDEIPFNSDITLVNIFIEDINDNVPVFEHPSAAVTHIGYPDADLVGLLLPSYLIKVEASDADEGVNAQIEYSLQENNYFGIDPKSGVIYPLTSEMGVDVFSLAVSASDSVHETTVELNVHKLTLDHLIVVYVENYGYHEMEDVTKTIDLQLGEKIQVLKYANVPATYVKRSMITRTTAGTNLKMVVYAFDEKDQLVMAEVLLEKLDKMEGTASFTLSSVKLQDEIVAVAEELDGDSEDTSNGTFVAVIITLGVLCLILLCAGFVGWWFWIRPTEWKHIEETTSVENVRVEPSTTIEVNEKVLEEMKERERPSVVLNGNTWTESSDSAPQIIKNITGLEETEPPSTTPATTTTAEPNSTPRERKKSITFNENVERIEIETEVPVTVKSYQF